MTRDPYNHKKIFENWLKSIEDKQEIEGLSKINSKLLIAFIKDFRIGMNVSSQSKKGERSYSRLNQYRHKIALILRLLEQRGINDAKKAKSESLHKLFNDMREGKIKTRKGTPYKSTGDYIKGFKAFWHWHQKIMKKSGKTVEDITVDLDTRGEKPKFVYFTKEDFEKIIDKASFDLKPIIALAFDSGARVTELMNITVSDFSDNFKGLNIKDESSKTFGRKIKLMLCSGQIKDYIEKLGLKREDYVCRKSPPIVNKELKKLGKEVLIYYKNYSFVKEIYGFS